MSDELDQDEFERAFEEASAAPKVKPEGRPPAPCGRDVAVYFAVCTAHKRGHPLSPPSAPSLSTRRPSKLRRPGASTGKCSAFAVVAKQLEIYKASAGEGASPRRLWAVGAYDVMSIYYRVAKHRALIGAVMLGDDVPYRFPVHTRKRIERWMMKQAAAATKQRC